MKKKMEKPFILMVKLDAMNVIATSGTPEDAQRPVTLRGMTTADSNKSFGF